MDKSRKCNRCAACRYAYQEYKCGKKLCYCVKREFSADSLCSVDSIESLTPSQCLTEKASHEECISQLQKELDEIKSRLICNSKDEKCSLLMADLSERYSRLLREHEDQQKEIHRLKSQNDELRNSKEFNKHELRGSRSRSGSFERMVEDTDYHKSKVINTKTSGLNVIKRSNESIKSHHSATTGAPEIRHNLSHHNNQEPIMHSHQGSVREISSGKLSPIKESSATEGEELSEAVKKHRLHVVKSGGQEVFEDTAAKEISMQAFRESDDKKETYKAHVSDYDEDDFEKGDENKKNVKRHKHKMQDEQIIETKPKKKLPDIDSTSESSFCSRVKKCQKNKCEDQNPVYVMCIEPNELKKIIGCQPERKPSCTKPCCPAKKRSKSCCKDDKFKKLSSVLITCESSAGIQDCCCQVKNLMDENKKLKDQEMQYVEQNCALGKTIAKLQIQLSRACKTLERYKSESKKKHCCCSPARSPPRLLSPPPPMPPRGPQILGECICRGQQQPFPPPRPPPPRPPPQLQRCNCCLTVIEPNPNFRPPPPLYPPQMPPNYQQLEERDKARLKQIQQLKAKEKELCSEIAKLKQRSWELSKMVTDSEIKIAKLNNELKEKEEIIKKCEEEKAIFELERIQLDQEKALLEQERAQHEQHKSLFEQERAEFEQRPKAESLRSSISGKASRVTVEPASVAEEESQGESVAAEVDTKPSQCTIKLSEDMQKLIEALYLEMENCRAKEAELECKNKNICCLEYALCERNRELSRLRREFLFMQRKLHRSSAQSATSIGSKRVSMSREFQ